MKIEIFINGIFYQKDVPPDHRLLDFLREDLGMKGTKKGCDQGECGACSVILNGKVVNSCLIMMVQLPEHSEVETIESTDSMVLSLQDSFVKRGATQCGACTPGMIMATTALLRNKPKTNDREVREELSGVICRCTGYQKIFDAIKDTQEHLERG
ncbi:MAG: (2Fe-2S)-binding protein [Candidatus Heimdallarchaeota archaeon]|nr:MAG: (2Fe-2S)-binding protein [Candidatus Heimdallarchaeota archaeon]